MAFEDPGDGAVACVVALLGGFGSKFDIHVDDVLAESRWTFLGCSCLGFEGCFSFFLEVREELRFLTLGYAVSAGAASN